MQLDSLFEPLLPKVQRSASVQIRTHEIYIIKNKEALIQVKSEYMYVCCASGILIEGKRLGHYSGQLAYHQFESILSL